MCLQKVFWVLFIVCGTWFNRNMFVGAILEAFIKLERAEKQYGIMLTDGED
jgi:hypothetical protein